MTSDTLVCRLRRDEEASALLVEISGAEARSEPALRVAADATSATRDGLLAGLAPRLLAARETGRRVVLEVDAPLDLLLLEAFDRLASDVDEVRLAAPALTVEADPAEPEPVDDSTEPAKPTTVGPATRGAAAPSAVAGAQPSPRPPSLGSLLNEVEKLAHRLRAAPAPDSEVIRAVHAHPDAGADIQKRIDKNARRGIESAEHLDRIRKHADRGDKRALDQELRSFIERFPRLEKKARQEVSLATARRTRRAEAAEARRHGRPLTSVHPGSFSHRLADLDPAPAWTLLIDETSRFPEDGGAPGPVPGRVVGLLVPEPSPLPALQPSWHAVDRSAAEIDGVLQQVLDAKVGVIGFGVPALTPGGPERWVAGVLEIIHWTLRLMPIDRPTRLQVRVEQRGDHSASDWRAAIGEILRGAGERDPDRIRKLSIDLKLIGKRDHALNGYVDAIAFTWGSPAQASRERLKSSGLNGSYLIASDSSALRRAWDKVARGIELSGAEWSRLVLDPEAAQPASITGILLDQLCQACRTSTALWSRYLAEVTSHLESKAIRLADVGSQIEWLVSARPESQLLPTLQLALLIARRERHNHQGFIDDPVLDAELERLSARLFDEVPQLVCQADLDQAVLATNRFDFAGAGNKLWRWVGKPPAMPGLQHWARLQSTLGQHAAFRGEHARAESLFLAALEAFGRLSDPALAMREQSQSGTYLAIATLDRPDAPIELVRERIGAIASLAPAEIERMARGADPATKYAHHLLLRYLVQCGSPAEREVYLGQREHWRSADGHPWQLIELYRALLVRDQDRAESERRLESALEKSLSQGPTVRFIGLVIGAIGVGWGMVNAAVLRREMDDLRDLLPLAPWSALGDALGGGLEPLALLRAVLPFNFR